MNSLEGNIQLEFIIKLQSMLQDYDYGVLKNGRIQGMRSAEEWDTYYRYMSPKDFERYHGGACWDYVAYQTEKLTREGIKFHNYYLEFVDDPNRGSHTITVCELGNMYVYMESSFKSIGGVYISDSLIYILDFILTEMYNMNKGTFSKKHIIRRYKHMMKYGITCESFMNYMYGCDVVRDADTFIERSVGNRLIKKNTEPYYRVTYNGIGIYEAFRQSVPHQVWLRFLKSDKATWLPKPPDYASGYESYFTKLGFSKFKTITLPYFTKFIDRNKIEIKEYINIDNIIYRDGFQVVVSTPYSESVCQLKYYFVSGSDKLKKLIPRIPDNFMTKNGYEDSKTPRVCFAPSIDQCLMAISQKCTGMELFVYVPDGDYKIYHPSVKEVPDVDITGEVWIKTKVKLKKIGKIKVIGDKGLPGHQYKYGNNTAELYDWDWRWIEKDLDNDTTIYHENARLRSNQNKTTDIIRIKNIINRIKTKVKIDSKEPSGNQNCMLCTWCLECQLRGVDILPRPVYSPRDVIFNLDGYSIVLSPIKLTIRDKNDVIKKVISAGNGARFYVHVNWMGSTGGHEFIVINLNNRIYVADAQSGTLADVKTSAEAYYFRNINYKNSFIVRMDDRLLNEDILKYNDNSYILEWNDDIDIPYLNNESINENVKSFTESKKCDKNLKFIDVSNPKAKKYLLQDADCKRLIKFYTELNIGEIIIDVDQDVLVGMIFVRTDDGQEGFIHSLMIKKEYRGYGLSHKLVDDAIHKYHGYDLIVSKTNDIAINLYKKHGFIMDHSRDTKTMYYMVLKSHKKEKPFTESYILNDKDIYYNKEKFDSGEINLCFITGHSGSGKSTMGNNMASDKIEHYDLDDVVANKMHFTMTNLKEYGDLIYSFFSGSGKKYFYTSDDIKSGKMKEIEGFYEEQLINDFVDYAMKYTKSHKNIKFVLEGIWLYEFIEPSKLKEYAVYIKGTSALISTIRAASRDSKEEYPDKKDRIKRFKSWWGRFKVLFTGGVGSTDNGLTIEKKIKKYRSYFSKLMIDK